MAWIVTMLASLAVATGTARAAAIVNVPADAPTIQQGIDSVGAGGTVVVAPGVYRENLAFGAKALEVRSASGPSATVIDGGGHAPVATFVDGGAGTTVLRGFTLRNAGPRTAFGGAIVIANASPTIVGNVITGNHVYEGGGVRVAGGAPRIEANLIHDNVTDGDGGAIELSEADGTVIDHNTIEGNSGDWGGAIAMWGSGSVLVLDNVFRGNHASQGGALSMVNYSDPLVAQNVFVDNDAGEGGAAYVLVPLGYQGATFVSNTMVANRSPAGAAVFSNGDYHALDNIMTNAPGDTTAVARCEGTTAPRYVANDVFNGADGAFLYCLDAGNLSVDPALRADFSLPAGSPLIDAGDDDPLTPLLQPTDATGSRRVVDGDHDGVATVDLGAFEWPGPGLSVSPQAAATSWSQPARSGLDGLAGWVYPVNDPAAGAGQSRPSDLYGLTFGFATGGASGSVSLLADPSGRYALLSVVEADGTPHAAIAPFAWTAGRFYLPFVYQLAPGTWGAWVYDATAGRWTTIGSLTLPEAWGELSPFTTTTAVWYGPPAPSCGAYPLADVVFSPPLGFAGPTAGWGTPGSTGTGIGDCASQASAQSGWARYRLGAGA